MLSYLHTQISPSNSQYRLTLALMVLVQSCNRKKRPIAYQSARFSLAVRNYTVGEQELLVVIYPLKKWRVHLEGAQHHVRLGTDQQTLTYLLIKGVLAEPLGPREANKSDGQNKCHVLTLNGNTYQGNRCDFERNSADAVKRRPCLSLYVTTRSQIH